MFDLGNGIDMSAVKSKRFIEVMEFYKRIGFFDRFPHFTVNGFPIYFDITKKRIGINLSSGADSTLLAYLLCEAIKKADCDTKIFPITFARHWEHNKWNEDAKQQCMKILQRDIRRLYNLNFGQCCQLHMSLHLLAC